MDEAIRRPEEQTSTEIQTDSQLWPAGEEASWRITWVSPPCPPQRAITPLGVPVVIGREPSAAGAATPVRLDWSDLHRRKESKLSRNHICLAVRDGMVVVSNVSTTNPIFLDGAPLAQGASATAGTGAVIRVGEYVGIVSDHDDAWCGELSAGVLGAGRYLYGGRHLQQQLDTATLTLRNPAADHLTVVLLEGPTGTGKEIVANNCAAIPASMWESEVFGIESGAATGVQHRQGHFRAAARGTLMLDEIQDLPLEQQPKLLRALEDGSVQPIGFSDPSRYPRVDVQIIAASSRPLIDEVAAGRFRNDLLGRLGTPMVRLPALRERREHILALALHFLRVALRRLDVAASPALHPELAEALCLHDWPRNIRQLQDEMGGVAVRFVAAKGQATEDGGAALTLKLLSEEVRLQIRERIADGSRPRSQPPSASPPRVIPPVAARTIGNGPTEDDARRALEQHEWWLSRAAIAIELGSAGQFCRRFPQYRDWMAPRVMEVLRQNSGKIEPTARAFGVPAPSFRRRFPEIETWAKEFRRRR